MVVTALWLVGSVGAQAEACTKPAKLGVAMMVDDSGSMSSSDPDELRSEGAGLAIDLLPDGSIAAAGSFDSYSREFFEPREVGPATREALKGEMYFSASGQTDFDLGFELAAEHLSAMPAGVDRKALIFLSDGMDNDGSWYEDQPIADQGIPIFTIAFGDADLDAMEEIASGDGRTGRLYAVSDSSGLQAAFADIVSQLTCRSAKLSQEVTFTPGETKEFPFQIGPGDKGWDGIVTWDSGRFDVSAVRPDGSRLTAGSTLGDEVYDSREEYRRRLGARHPATGDWKLVVTAAADNADDASVELRIYDQDAGGATITVNLPEKDLPFVIPRVNKVKRGINAVTGTPFSLWVRPYVGLNGKVSPGISVPETISDDPKAYSVVTPAATWDFSAESFRWNGPAFALGTIGVKPPEFFLPEVAVEAIGANPIPGIDDALLVSFARVLELDYRQEFPVEPLYASLTFRGGLKLQAGAYVVDAAAWAAVRALAALGIGAVTGGSGTAAVAAFTVKQTTAATAAKLLEIASLLQQTYNVVIDNQELARQLTEGLKALAARLGPEIMSRIKRAAGQAVRAMTAAVTNVVKNVRKRVFGVFSEARAAAVAQDRSPAALLSARMLTGRPRLRSATVARKRIKAILGRVNRYGNGRPVRVRSLLVAGKFAARRSLAVAAVLPSAPRGKDKVAVLTLVDPRGKVRERLVKLRDRVAGARIKLPRSLARGRWQLALATYPDQANPASRAEIAVAEFTVRKRKR